MDRKTLRSSVNVVLMALLFGLVGQAMAKDPSSYTCFKPEPRERITIDHLNIMLGSSFFTDKMFAPSCAQRVFWRLEDAMDKNKANAILGLYSVQQLLDWNTWTVDECTIDGLEKRRQQCDSFCSQKQIAFTDPPQRLIKVNRQEAFILHNLGNYCWNIVIDMHNRCPHKQLLGQMDQKELDKVWKAFTSTRRPMFSSSSLDIAKTMKKLAEYLTEKGPLESAELWNHCSTVIKVYDAPRSYKFTVGEDWFYFLKFCRAFTSGFTSDGRARDDFQEVETN